MTDVKFPKRLLPHISGVEVTQGIQYFHSEAHLTDPNDRAPDNSAGFVADKPAWVRVYIDAGIFPLFFPFLLTGTLLIRRRGGFPFPFPTTTTLNPQSPGTVPLQSLSYVDQRRDISNTLNFIVPAREMRGEMHFSIKVFYRTPFRAILDKTILEIDATRCQTLPLRGIPVTYNGPNETNTQTITINPPTLSDLTSTAAFSLAVCPVSSTPNLSFTGGVTLNVPLTGEATEAGGCSEGWITLNEQLAEARAADGNQPNTIYYGLLPLGVPTGEVTGCTIGGLGSGAVGNQTTMTHEIGHALGFDHTPCIGYDNDPDDQYPAYEPYDTPAQRDGSIGEFGLDINNGTVHRPDIEHCFMSYCFPRWVSLYNHLRMIGNPRLLPRRCHVSGFNFWDRVIVDPFLIPPEYIPDPPPGWNRFREAPVKHDVDPVPVISVIGAMRHGEIEIQHVHRVSTRRNIPGARSTAMRAELIGADGKVVASAPVVRLTPQGCGCGGGEAAGPVGSGGCGCGGRFDEKTSTYVFQALIPDVEPGDALRLIREDVELAKIEAPATKPGQAQVEAALDKGLLTVKWGDTGASPGSAHEYWVRYSADQGATWTPIRLGIAERQVEVDASSLPAGHLLIDVVAHNGFHSVASSPVPVEIPPATSAAVIMHPYDGSRLLAGGPMRLWGAVVGNIESPSDRADARWYIDGEEVSDDLDGYIPAPAGGEHDVRLVIRTEYGESDSTVRIVTFDAE